MEQGFTEVVAEKALYKVDNASLQHAMNWALDHSEDPDYELPMKPPKAAPPTPAEPEKPKMSKEEAEAKAMELQAKLREKRLADEKQSEKDRERARIESTKMMLETNAKLAEEERKRALEQQRREKEEHDKYKDELKERLKQDYRDRFGCDPPDSDEEKEGKVKEKSSKDQAAFHLNKLKKTYKDTNREGLKTCLATLKIYIKNLQENPSEEKFKKLKVENKAFQSRIAPFDGAIDLLDVLGFEDKGEFLVQRKGVPDGWLCGQAIKFIDLMVSQC